MGGGGFKLTRFGGTEQKSLETTSQGGGWTALKAHFGVRGAHNWCSMGECFCPNRTMVGRWVSLVGLADISFADIPTPCHQSGWVLSPIGGGFCPESGVGVRTQ